MVGRCDDSTKLLISFSRSGADLAVAWAGERVEWRWSCGV